VDKPPTKDKAMVGRTLASLRALVPMVSSVMGLFERRPEEWLLERRERAVRQKGIDARRVQSLIEERSRARAKKDYREADRLRDELRAMGVELTDKPLQTTWKVASERGFS